MGSDDEKCDVWSIGVIAYMLLTGEAPFIGETDDDVLAAVRSGRWQFEPHAEERLSEEAKDFIGKCLSRAFWRPTSASALKHKWFKTCEGSTKDAPPSPLLMRRMGNFIVRSVLAKIFIEVLAHTVLPEHAAELKAQFKKFDVSHTGRLYVPHVSATQLLTQRQCVLCRRDHQQRPPHRNASVLWISRGLRYHAHAADGHQPDGQDQLPRIHRGDDQSQTLHRTEPADRVRADLRP
jgi:serine/threonine protein kinase